MQDIVLIIILLTIIWYWWDTMRSKEAARIAGKQACLNAQVQFLDDTVELKKIWVRRNQKGSLELCRLFFFEFASDGELRYQGRVMLTGRLVREVEMDAYRI
jgi:hypothetical protein